VLSTYDDVKYGVYATTTSGLSGNQPILYIVGVYGEDKARDRTALVDVVTFVARAVAWELLKHGEERGVILGREGRVCRYTAEGDRRDIIL
jgi:hypothetical protein